MKKQLSALIMICALALTACAELPENALLPMIGLEWFAEYDAVKQQLAGYTLTEERQKEENHQIQKMQDYADVPLFEINCDLTLCFYDSGLVGFNYHDTEHHQNFHEWLDKIELIYGLPTEEGNGMASWYDNPLGKNTAVYVFNLEEGVQISVYATADSPDKSYEKQRENIAPVPEIRTPIVPVVNETVIQEETDADTEESVSETTAVSTAEYQKQTAVITVQADDNTEILPETEEVSVSASSESQTEAPSSSTTVNQTQTTTAKAVTETTATTSTVSQTSERQQESATENKTEDSRLKDLQFYGSPDSERRKMSAYTQLYEYRTEEPGQPWELIMEYSNVPYEGQNCDAVLCFTSLGLVGINYLDADANHYDYWINQLTKIYGAPDDVQSDYTAWNSEQAGNTAIMIYVFALDDGVQISFFADDTGSELVR